MKIFLKKIASFLAGIYVFMILGTAVYFNYDFAKNNGFTKWLLFGQIIPTLKSAAWPYFLILNKNKNQKNENVMPKSLSAISESMKISIMIDHLNPNNEKDRELAITLLSKSLNVLKKINAEELYNIHPGLGDNVIKNWIPYLNCFSNGIKNRDPAELARAKAYLERWEEWLIKNKTEMEKIFNKY